MRNSVEGRIVSVSGRSLCVAVAVASLHRSISRPLEAAVLEVSGHANLSFREAAFTDGFTIQFATEVLTHFHLVNGICCLELHLPLQQMRVTLTTLVHYLINFADPRLRQVDGNTTGEANEERQSYAARYKIEMFDEAGLFAGAKRRGVGAEIPQEVWHHGWTTAGSRLRSIACALTSHAYPRLPRVAALEVELGLRGVELFLPLTCKVDALPMCEDVVAVHDAHCLQIILPATQQRLDRLPRLLGTCDVGDRGAINLLRPFEEQQLAKRARDDLILRGLPSNSQFAVQLVNFHLEGIKATDVYGKVVGVRGTLHQAEKRQRSAM